MWAMSYGINISLLINLEAYFKNSYDASDFKMFNSYE